MKLLCYIFKHDWIYSELSMFGNPKQTGMPCSVKINKEPKEYYSKRICSNCGTIEKLFETIETYNIYGTLVKTTQIWKRIK